MWDLVGIERTKDDMLKALSIITKLENEFKYTNKCSTFEEYEFRNLLCVSKIITTLALQRCESRGGHYRKDFPDTLTEAKHSSLVKDEKENDKIFTA